MGAAIETRYLVRQADVDAGELGDAGQERLGLFLRRSGDDGARVVGELDAAQVQRTFRQGEACGASAAGGSTLASSCLSDAALERWGGVLRRSELDAQTLERHVEAMNALDDQQAALRLLEATGDDGIRALNRLVDADDVDADKVVRQLDEFDGAATRGVTGALSDGVDATRVSRSLDRYDELADPALRRQFEELLAHHEPEVRNSWLRQSGRPKLASNAIEDSLKWTVEIKSRNHIVQKYISDSEANDGFDEYPPYPEGTIIVEIEVNSPTELQRVVRESRGTPGGDGPEGRFFIPDEEAVRNLDYSPDKIKSMYAIKDDPYWLYDAEVPKGTTMYVGKVARNYGEPGGGTQYQLAERLPDEQFEDIPTNKRKLDVEED